MKYLLLSLASLILLTGCPPFTLPPKPAEINLVVLGGLDMHGHVLDEAVYYQLRPYGNLSRAGTGRSIGEPRFSSVAVSQRGTLTVTGGYISFDEEPSGAVLHQHGEHLFLIGGRDAAGNYRDRILTRKVDEDTWRETIPFPVEIAFPSVFSIGSRLFVLGGENADGALDLIRYTLINQDGDLGYSGTSPWRNNNPISPIRLPYPVSRAASVFHEGRVFLVGGSTPEGATDRIIHARISPNASVGQWYISPRRLPEPRTLAAAAVVYTQTGDFSIFQKDASVEGPSHWRTPNGIYALSQEEDQELTFISFPSMEPKVPEVFPGSGVVGQNSLVQFIHDPDSVVEYSRNRTTWENAEGLKITKDSNLWFRATWGAVSSPEMPVTYQTQRLGFTIYISGNIPVGESVEEEYQDLELLVNSHWWTFSSPGEKISLEFLDAGNSDHTAQVEITLMERDLYTEVLDRSGSPVSRVTSDEIPIRLSLQKGSYRIHVRELSEDSTGKTMGIRIRRDP